MRKITILVAIFVALAFLAPAPVLANGSSNGTTTHSQMHRLTDPGTLPSSPFYFLERFSERMRNVFIRSKERKAQRQLQLAEERLAESLALVESGDAKQASSTIARYKKQLRKATNAVDTSTAISTLAVQAASSTLTHQAVLADVYKRVPEAAKPAISHAISVSIRGHQQASAKIPESQRAQADKDTESTREKVHQRLQELRDQGVDIPDYAGPPTDGQKRIPSEKPDDDHGSDNNQPGPPSDRGPGQRPGSAEKPPLAQAQQAPNKDACVLVSAGVCPCSSGGKKIAINEKYKQRWQRWLDTQRQGGMMACPQVYRCGDYTITYEGGQCRTEFEMEDAENQPSENMNPEPAIQPDQPDQ